MNRIDFNSITRINLDGLKNKDEFKTLSKEVIEKCKCMEALSMKDCLLNRDKINNIDFDKISWHLKEVDLSKNKDIESLNFLTKILI